MKQRKTKRIRKHRSGLGLIAVVVLLLCGVISYNRVGLEAENIRSQERIQELENQKKSLQEESEDIKDYKAYVQTKKYVEETAREKLGLVYKDEIIFEPEDK